MTRRCSHCSNNGHNSRTCPSRGGGASSCSSGAGGGGGGGVKLFGVRLTDGSIIKKSASMGNLSSMAAHYQSSSPNPESPSYDPLHDPVHDRDGYLSDDPAHASSTNRRGDRKKGVWFFPTYLNLASFILLGFLHFCALCIYVNITVSLV